MFLLLLKGLSSFNFLRSSVLTDNELFFRYFMAEDSNLANLDDATSTKNALLKAAGIVYRNRRSS